MECEEFSFSQHALRRMFERAITPTQVKEAILKGETIESYPDDLPCPSRLMLWRSIPPLHVVVAQDLESRTRIVITAYYPDAALWSEDFTKRRP